MKSSKFAALLLLLASCTAPSPQIIWREGAGVHEIVVRNARSLPEDWTIWFSQMPAAVEVLEGSDATIEQHQANLYKIRPLGIRADTLTVRYRSDALKRRSWAPEGFVLQSSASPCGKPLKAEYEFLPLEADAEQWYRYNSSLKVEPVALYDIIPAPKRAAREAFAHCASHPQGWYSIAIDSAGEVEIESDDADGHFYAELTLKQLLCNSGGTPLRNIYIEDWPDFQYRGYMLDVARNFTSLADLKKLIDVIARYKVNYLHLHLADDEGWRIEIDGIPELTSIGAFHSLDPEKGLQPSYDGCADPSSKALSNGYYTREDFIDILRYAWERRIRVIPEFDTPGHSRAAIYAMKAYERRTGDSSLKLQDESDASVYESAQGYTDNVMSVELESVYSFVERIFDCFIGIYADASVPLAAIHIGGDEVPSGAWNSRDLHEIFLGRVADIALGRGVKIAGWQEVAACSDPVVAGKLKAVLFMNNVWNTAWGGSELPYENAAKGYPTVLSNVEYTYADQAYSSNKEERAHSWAGYIDDTKSLALPLRKMDNIIGAQAQLFTETVRSFEDVCYNSFPKIMGVFERAWNAECRRTPSEFYSSIVQFEMPWWEEQGICFHIPQPGMIMVDGELKTNSAIPGAKIEISPNGRQARATYCSARSCTSTLR